MINLVETTPPSTNPNQPVNFKDRRWIATIRSTMVNKWSGQMSVLDKEINNRYQARQQPLVLDRDFMLTESDLINLFSTCYIASRRD